MALNIGDKAPLFTLPTIAADGPQLVSLADFFGKKNTLLLFFPMAYTSVCTTEMCSASQGLTAYESLNATVLGLSGDNPFAQQAWAKKEDITIPLLSDYEHAVARAYGVAYDAFLPHMNLPMGGVSKRSAFIVDKFGIIQHTEVLEDARDIPNFDAISSRLTALQ